MLESHSDGLHTMATNQNATEAVDFAPRRRRNGLDVPKSAGRGRVGRSNSTSSVLDTHDEFHRRLYDPALAPHLQRRSVRSTKQNGVASIVDFLRNTEPPSDNFMSIPDQHDERGRGWVKWASFGRSKSAPRSPPSIRLPDTAVSGTTIGGHRHIAITIPSQAFPMGDLPRSQYPVYSTPPYSLLGERKPIPSPNGFYQTVINDKGTVTVLRTIDEQGRQHRSGRLTPQRNTRQALSRNGSIASNGSSSLPPSRGTGSVTFADRLQRPRTSPQRFPTRSSSRTRISAHQPASIDSIIAEDDEFPRALLDVIDDDYQREATAELYANKPLPKIKGEEDNTTGSHESSNDSGAATLPNNPLGTNAEKSATASKNAESRRDKVRDKKQRDLEALLSLRKKRVQPAGDRDRPATSPEGQPTLTSIKVVIDVEPTPVPGGEKPPPKDPRRLQFETTTPIKNRNSAPSSLTPPIIPDQKPRAAEAPESPSRRSLPVPPRKQVPLDRTALLRRREWNATRKQERKGKEARPSVVAQAKRLAAEMNDDPSNMQAVDREILRLYEAFREHRFREMEKRLRRLERNGDIWLRALVPVLQSLHTGGVPRPDSAPVPGQGQEDEDTASLYGSITESEDLDGLDAIEPLMRELAGAAAVRQMRSARLLRAF